MVVTFLENGDWEGIILYLFWVIYITFGMCIRHCVNVSGSPLHVGRVGLGTSVGSFIILVVWRLG